MELIPILSLIILVATISTFVLAVGAYILYKVRERKGKIAQASQPAAIPGEMIAPSPLMGEQRATRATFAETGTGYRTGFRTGQTAQQYQQQPIFATQQNMATNQGLNPTYSQPPTASTFTEQRYTRVPTNYQENEESEKRTEKKKFMRYTNEGYSQPTKEKNKEEDSLRWR